MKKIILIFVTVTMSFSFVSAALFAQSIWLGKDSQSQIAVEALKPEFKGNDELTFASSAIFVSGRFFMGDAIVLVGELPISHVGADNFDSQTTIGNPYVGIELRRPDGSYFIEVGARLPLASDDKFIASLFGAVTDVDRIEAFFPDIVTFYGKLNFKTVNSSNVVFRLRGGPSILTNADDVFEGDNMEVLIDYSAQVGLQGRISVLGGITGRYGLTGDGGFGDRSVHFLGASAMIDLGSISPGIQFRLPLDKDVKDLIDYVIGLNLLIEIQ